MKFSTDTPKGRLKYDAYVAKKLLDVPMSRGDVARRLGVEFGDAKALRVVAKALKRGVRDGWARVVGNGAWAKYSRRDQ